MKLDIATTALLSQMAASEAPPMHELSPEEARLIGGQMAKGYPDGPAMVSVKDVEIPARDGAKIRARVLKPSESPRGLLVFYHGGGWVLSNIDEYDTLGRQLAKRTGCAVLMVDYRKAPEHPFPAAPNDAWEALLWANDNMAALAGRKVPLLVAGDSAGGNLVAMVCLRARDARDTPIQGQLLFYPVTAHYDPPTPSYEEFAEGCFLTRDSMRWFIDQYLGAAPSPADAFPLGAQDLRGLPPALVMTAECDPLRDEGQAYADRLRASGVACAYRCVDGMLHGFMAQTDLHPQAQEAMREACAWIRAHPARPRASLGLGR